MEPIKVLHVVSKMDRAGQETFIMNVYRHIDRQKIQFDFLCSDSTAGDYDNEIRSLGGQILYLHQSKINIPYVTYLGVIRSYMRFFREHPEYKIAHFHNYHAFGVLLQVLGAKLGRVKHIFVHSHNTNAPHPTLHKISKQLLKLFDIKRVACSEPAGQWMFGSKCNDFIVLKNAIEPSLFVFNAKDRERIKDELCLQDKKIILHIGRFNYQKNHMFLLRLYEQIHKKCPNTRLLLVGRGELEEQVRKWVHDKNLDDAVSFLGIREDIPALLSASDLFVFPSLFEGLSVVLVEAQANGIDILATPNLAKETIYAKNVYQIPLNSIDSWKNKSVELLSREHIRSDMTSLVKDAGFDINLLAIDLTQIYLDTIYNR